MEAIIVILLVAVVYFLYQSSPGKKMKDNLAYIDLNQKGDLKRIESYTRKVADAEKEKGTSLTKEEKEKIAKVVDYEITEVGPMGVIVSFSTSMWRYKVEDEDVKYPENRPASDTEEEDDYLSDDEFEDEGYF